MKRLLGVVALTAVLAVLMTGCGKFRCGVCMEEKYGKRHKDEDGQGMIICAECYEELTNLAEMLE